VERLKEIKKKQEDSQHQENRVIQNLKKLILQTDNLQDENFKNQIMGKIYALKNSFETEESPNIEFNLTEIKSITDRILNPYSHDDVTKPLYKSELEDAINIIRNQRNSL